MLIASVYAPKVHLDYTSLLGGSPQDISSEEWAKNLESILGAYDSTQHTVQ